MRVFDKTADLASGELWAKEVDGPLPPSAGTISETGTATHFLLLLTAAEAAVLCRTSVRTWRTWDSAGKVPRPIRIGRAKLWRPDELREWVAEGCPERSVWNHR